MSSVITNQFAYHSGRTVGRYKLEELLGRGATAEVYKSMHPDLQREIAIKILHPFQSHDSGFVQRFQHEAKAVASLIHPNIVQVYDFNITDDGLYYITMQYIDGPTLADYMVQENGPLPLSKAFQIFKPIADALHFAHQIGVIHRDIKPANVMIDSRGRAYLGDFGFAQIIGVEMHTHSSLTPGTPIYMAPEQIASSKVTAVADIYALGVILYEMVTGKIPYYGDNLMAVILRKLDEPPALPRQYNPTLPVSVEKVIMRSMAREPEDRYPDVASMSRALQEAFITASEDVHNGLALFGSTAVPLPWETIDNYQIESPFAGDVRYTFQRYYAVDMDNKRKAVITVLRDTPADSTLRVGRFQERAKRVVELEQAGIVQARRTGMTADNRPYLAYDMVEGCQLSDQLQEWQATETVLAPEKALSLVEAIATALTAAHDADLIHNDLRPEHIVLDANQVPTLVGLEIPAPPLTSMPKYWDVLNYVPPEQMSERRMTRRGNIYTLGVLLYELLAGRRPQVAQHALLSVEDDFRPSAEPLSQHRAGLSRQTVDLVDSCLAGDEGQRPSDLATLLTLLQAARAAEVAVAAGRPNDGAAATGDTGTRRRLAWAALIAFALVLVVGLAWTRLVAPATVGPETEPGVVAAGPTEPGQGDEADLTEEEVPLAAVPAVASDTPTPTSAAGAPAELDAGVPDAEAADNAQEALDARATAEAVEVKADASARLATGRELAAAAISLVNSDPQLSLLLALEAVNLTWSAEESPPGEAVDALYRALFASTQALTLAGHTAQVNDVALSPDGRWIATVSDDFTVKLWEAATGQAIHTLIEHTTPVTSLAFSPDNEHLISGSDDSLLVLWDVEAGTLVRRMRGEDDGGIRAVAFHPDGARVGVGYEQGTARVWDSSNGTPLLRQFEHVGPINDILFSPDGLLFATAGQDGVLVTQNADTGRPIFSYFPEQAEDGEPIAITGIDFNRDGSRIAMAKANGRAVVWEGETRLAELSGHSAGLSDVAFSPDAERLVTASADGSAKLWQIDTQQIIQTLSGHTGGVTATAYMPRGDRIVTTSQDGTARIWNTDTELEPLTFSNFQEGINDVSFNADGSELVSAGQDRVARIWEPEAGDILQLFRGHDRPVTAAAYHPSQPIVATASRDTNVRIWDMSSGEVQLPFYFHPASVQDLAFNNDGSLLATGAVDGIVRLWDMNEDRVVLALPGDGPVQAVSFRPDGTELVAAMGETAVVWDSSSGERGWRLTGHNGLIRDVAYDPSGLHIATAGDDGVVKLWDLASGEAVRTFSGHSGPVLSVAFSSDGSQLATASVDKTAKIWDTESGQALRTVLGHTSAINAIDFNPDDTTLATGSLDSTIRLTPLVTFDELVGIAWSRLSRPLSEEECAQYLRELPCRTRSLTAPLIPPTPTP